MSFTIGFTHTNRDINVNAIEPTKSLVYTMNINDSICC
jgi:hypothetical protein